MNSLSRKKIVLMHILKCIHNRRKKLCKENICFQNNWSKQFII